MNKNDIYFDLPIIFTKQVGFGRSLKIKAGDVVELPPDAVLVFPRTNTEIK